MNKIWQRVKWFPVLLALIFSTSSGLWAQVSGKVKVAAIYTVPVEQQWVSRIHKALNAAKARGEIEYSFSENVANTDYERVMREYSEQGNHLLVGEVFGVERAARKVAKDYPSTSYLMGSSFGPSGKNFSVFDNWIHEPSYSAIVAFSAAAAWYPGRVEHEGDGLAHKHVHLKRNMPIGNKDKMDSCFMVAASAALICSAVSIFKAY